MELAVTILGSGAGQPSRKRACSGYVLSVNDRLLLLDCGSGVTRSFLQAGLNPDRVEYIFISHMHPDHVSDLPYFIQMLKLNNKRGRLVVYVPSEAVETVRDYLITCYLLPERMEFALSLMPHETKLSIFNDVMNVRLLPNNHLMLPAGVISEGGYPNLMQCYSFLLEAPDHRILYSADLASLDDIAEDIDELDLLIIETTHIELKELLHLAELRRVEKIILTHIADEDEADVAKHIRTYSGDSRLILAEDGLTIGL